MVGAILIAGISQWYQPSYLVVCFRRIRRYQLNTRPSCCLSPKEIVSPKNGKNIVYYCAPSILQLNDLVKNKATLSVKKIGLETVKLIFSKSKFANYYNKEENEGFAIFDRLKFSDFWRLFLPKR